MGLKAIKKGYWEAGNTQIEVYYRRRNIEDEWIWIAGSVSSVMVKPVAGLVMQERCPPDENIARHLNKLTRIASVVANVIEESYSWTQLTQDGKSFQSNAPLNAEVLATIPGLADEAAALKAFLNNTPSSDSSSSHGFLRVMDTATQHERARLSQPATLAASYNGANASTYKKGGGDTASSVLEVVTEGPCIHVNKITLAPTVVKMIVLLITGQMTIHDLALYMLHPMNASNDMDIFLDNFVTEDKVRTHHKHEATSHHRHEPRASFHSRRRRPSEASISTAVATANMSLHQTLDPILAPPISCINISYSAMGDDGMEQFCDALCSNTPALKTIDLSFCNIGERGMLELCRSMHSRRRKGLAGLQGLILSGNTISFKAAKELGNSLSPAVQKKAVRATRKRQPFLNEPPKEGYDEDDEFGSDDDDDEDDDDDLLFGRGRKRGSHSRKARTSNTKKEKNATTTKVPLIDDPGIKLLHLSSTSMTGPAVLELMLSLTEMCRLEELDLSSNHIGVEGISLFVDFLEGTQKKKQKGSVVMPQLNRMNLSDNNLGNDGIAKLTRAVSKRKHISLVDLHLGFNNVESAGTGTLMNKLLQHNIVSLSLDNNLIGDSGCQLVAASLTSMHYLSRLNLSFNQIGCRGITSLMRALLGCETITFLGLSGNVMKITGAIAMGFALAHHPRLAHLDLDNCCLSQVAQCHISAGMISNRWVPMQIVNGFRVGPPLAAIGALDIIAQHLGNTECLSIRRNMQMKANLQLMEVQKASKSAGGVNRTHADQNSQDFLSVDFLSSDGNGPPSQSAYLRMLDWLSRIPFDEDELDNLRRYFYDIDDESPDGLRGSDGRLNLKVRGDLLAALGSNLEKEMRETEQNITFPGGPSIGLSLTPEDCDSDTDDDMEEPHTVWESSRLVDTLDSRKKPRIEAGDTEMSSNGAKMDEDYSAMVRNHSSGSENSFVRSESVRSTCSLTSQGDKASKSLKARISMFPQFLEKLDLLKSNAQDMMDAEVDPMQQDIIAQQFAEASLILLRQLRYHCMNSGLDGWRQGKIRRKVLIVDDSLVTRKLVARAFEKANFIVDTAQNGEEGVIMMKESIYDIAFMDIDMPVMNGFDATKALRIWENSSRPGARQPICALTAAYVDDFELSELMKFKEAGLDVMESKPCNIPRLFKVVDDVSPMFSDLSISVTQLHDYD